MSQTLPTDKDFTANDVPPEHRRWYELALLRPLNEFRRAVHALLAGGLTLASNINAQVLGPVRIETDTGPTWATKEFDSKLRGACIGIQVLRVQELDSANQPTTNAIGTWGPPLFEERTSTAGRRRLRLLAQSGPSASKVYSVAWLAWGA